MQDHDTWNQNILGLSINVQWFIRWKPVYLALLLVLGEEKIFGMVMNDDDILSFNWSQINSHLGALDSLEVEVIYQS